MISLRLCHRRLYATPKFTYAEWGDFLDVAKRNYHLMQESQHFPLQIMLEINSQLKELVKNGQLENARHMFDKMTQRDEVSWTNMISGYVNASSSLQALSLFSEMRRDPILKMDPFALSLAVKACGLSMNLRCGESLHAYSIKADFVSSVFVGSSLVDMYMKAGKMMGGCRFFDEMPLRNVVSWTAVITGLVRAGYNEEGLVYFSEMWRDSVECDSYAYAIVLKACADIGCLNYGREMHTRIVKKGLDISSYVANSLATMYNKCGKLNYGMCLFERMKLQDVVSWTTVITTYVQIGQDQYGIQAFLRMKESSVTPNAYTFAAVVAACANLARLDWGVQLHANVVRVGFLDSLSVSNSIVTMYSKCGQLGSASLIFHEMSRKDIVSWSTIIAGYAQGGCGEEAFKLLSWMRKEGPKPTEFALASVLGACGSMAILDQGKQLHAHVLIIGLDHTPLVLSALINMYSKCGSIAEASKIFNSSQDIDVVSWTAMINGYAEHGYSRDAISLFEKVLFAGLRPDSVTFIGVLSACSHAGLVDLGFQYFKLMKEEYKISLSKEHYGCMIDLLCRAGRIIDAENMIKNMPFEKDDVVWSILLRGCRLHGDVECGRRAAEQILKLAPNCAVTHTTLSNIYASKGKWGEVAELRKLMRLKGVMKEPGWSWIKVKDQVSAFVAGDKRHPQNEDIYDILDLISSKMEFSLQNIASILE
ncbi:putative pentatricopeptide repeat-containing protein At3g47840 [Nicotiana tomentosiformis]|uniref:putative pentatricopeptide repeat-containing protein At3g47840 n=1 Tax=Nicotiana tomentosiformis TaxID=4098 RepID=UPI00051BE829|nr:putative pentatricopeptide repeat-containing protein At3g47840 [Nicotiana tomentosiformis]